MRKLATVIVFQCKQCGGELSVKEGDTLATCEYCGSTQTLPSSQDEHLKGLFVRANGLRLKNAFDKAASLYEDILREDSTQAEAYWGLLLCEYGIEYVVDPETERRVPTCHRLSYTPISESENYAEAMRYADGRTKVVYQQNAETLEALRKAVAAKAKQAQPVDVFICYKESEEGDLSRRRTLDSELAGSLYDDLTEAGFKVFFARESLKEYSGEEYEPYIFAALHSAKVMLVVATSRAHIDATWVKNEWSRYLTLMAADPKTKRRFVPCIKNMEPEDLPDRFVRYECANLGEPGAQDDLVRSLKKFLRAQPEQQAMPQTMTTATATTVELLMKRAENELRFGNWEKASSLYDQVINVQPESAEAYLGLILATSNFSTREQFEQQLLDLHEVEIKMVADAATNRMLHQKIRQALTAKGILQEERRELEVLEKELKEEIRAGISSIYPTLTSDVNKIYELEKLSELLGNMSQLRENASGFGTVNLMETPNFKALRYYANGALKSWLDELLEKHESLITESKRRINARLEDRMQRVQEITSQSKERERIRQEKLRQERERQEAEDRAWRARVHERNVALQAEVALCARWQKRHNTAILAPHFFFADKNHFLAHVVDSSADTLIDVSLSHDDVTVSSNEKFLQAVYVGGNRITLDPEGTLYGSVQGLPGIDGAICQLAVGGVWLYALEAETARIAYFKDAQWHYLPPREENFFVTHLYAGRDGIIVKDTQNNGFIYLSGEQNVHVKHNIRMGAVGAGFHAWLDCDGRVSVARNAPDISAWADERIAAISAGNKHLLALTADGRVLAAGDNDAKQCEVGSWENCIAVVAGPNYSVAIQEDGTLISTHPRIRRAFANRKVLVNGLDWSGVVQIQEQKEEALSTNITRQVRELRNRIDTLNREAGLTPDEYQSMVTSQIDNE